MAGPQGRQSNANNEDGVDTMQAGVLRACLEIIHFLLEKKFIFKIKFISKAYCGLNKNITTLSQLFQAYCILNKNITVLSVSDLKCSF